MAEAETDLEDKLHQVFDSPLGEQLFPTIYKALEQRSSDLAHNHADGKLSEILFLTDSDEFLTSSDEEHKAIVIDFTRTTLGAREVEVFLETCFSICGQLPRVRLDTNFHKLSDIFVCLDFQGEFVWSIDFRLDLMLEAYWEGFLIVAYQCKFNFKNFPCFFEILLPKLHRKRTSVHLQESRSRSLPKSVRKRGRKSHYLHVSVDKDFDGVLQGLSKQHTHCWVNYLMKRLWKRWHSLESRLIEMKLPTLHSVELWDGNNLVAGEIGVCMGSIYTSLTGFHAVSGTGSLQLWALYSLLQSSGYSLWDLGMYMDYKMDLNAVIMERLEFINLLRHQRSIEPKIPIQKWKDHFGGSIPISSIIH